MVAASTLTASVFTLFLAQSRLSERKLGDIAVISVPRSVKEMYQGLRDDQPGRLTFTFSSAYFWASFGSSTAYKQQIFVSVMAPDATDAQYEELPIHYGASYDHRTTVRKTSAGPGVSLTVTEGVYRQNTLQEPAYTFVYVDRPRRLQITWHAVKTEVDLTSGIDIVGKMAASFRIVRDPAKEFAEMRDRPRREAETEANRRETAVEMLRREGYGPLRPGQPVLKSDVYVEWRDDPEPRFQLLLPLGRVRVDPASSRASRPRPVALSRAAGTSKVWAGSIGWREFMDDQWELSNRDNAYLPFSGIEAALATAQPDPHFTYFYYSATVRVELADGDHLTNLQWFFSEIPEVRRLWREGKLLTAGTPERD